MNVKEYDNVVKGSGILASQIYDSLVADRVIPKVCQHKIVPMETGIMISGGGCFDYDDYTETDEKCGARTLRLDEMAYDILCVIKNNALRALKEKV